MNPNSYEFEPVTEPVAPEKKDWPIFKVGEVFNLGGVPMVVRKITKKDIVLRPKKGA